MKRSYILIIVLFFNLVAIAQVSQKRDSASTVFAITKGIDTLRLQYFLKDELSRYHNYASSGLLAPETDVITIDKKVLLSLLKPYYTISIDSVRNDSLIAAEFSPKYRLKVNNITNDSTYIPLPKEERLFIAEKKLAIDTIKVIPFIKPIVIDTIQYAADPVWWNKKNSIALDISQAAFVNWNAGGENSIAGLVRVNLERTYKKLQTLWKNEVAIRYGVNKQRGQELRKTDDRIQLSSTFGYRKDTISKWYYSVKFSLRTQFTDGFSYPNTETPISRFFAPGYLFLGLGTQYNSKKNTFTTYLSPITLKSTFVFDDRLSNEGAFGVDPGRNARHEFGTLVEIKWQEPLFKNVLMVNRINFYSDYLNNFGNIDTNWELNFKLKVNKFIQANLGAHLIYDNDIKFKEDINNDGILETTGARAQFKQVLAIGVLYRF